MNKRINELFGQALDTAVPYTWHNLDHVEVEKVMKVFAESIMRECISVMKSTVDESIDFDRKLDETSSWIESDIKKHFGVEL